MLDYTLNTLYRIVFLALIFDNLLKVEYWKLHWKVGMRYSTPHSNRCKDCAKILGLEAEAQSGG